MNALSSIRQWMPPELKGAGLPDAAMKAGAAGIPASELAKLGPTGLSGTGAAAPASGENSFGSLLQQFTDDVQSKQAAASGAVRDLLSGQNVSLHQAVIAMEEASISFQLMVEVRNKLLECYQEIMRMQI